MKLAYGVCVSSDRKFREYVLPRVEPGAMVNTRWSQVSIATAYNEMLAEAIEYDIDVLILQHDDLEITDPQGVAALMEALTWPMVALAGVAGGDGQGLAWWNGSPIGQVMSDQGMIDLGRPRGFHEVNSLDGMLIAMSRWAIENLCFWDRPGFHGYDCDISAQARAAGRSVVIVPIDVHHHTTLGFKSVASEADWLDADRQYREKWGIADA